MPILTAFFANLPYNMRNVFNGKAFVCVVFKNDFAELGSVPFLGKLTVRQLLPITISFLLSLSVSAFAQTDAEAQFSDAELRAITSHGPWPQTTPADAGNSLSGQDWAEALGSTLFFEPGLSSEGRVSCASCHVPSKGFSDALTVAQGAQAGVRNSQGLLDAGLQRWFGWDGGADSLWAAAMRPMLAAHEMAGTIAQLAQFLRNNEQFVGTINEELGRETGQVSSPSIPPEQAGSLSWLDDEAVVVLAAKSIGAYVRTLQSARTPFDDYRDALRNNDKLAQSNYPEAAKRGLKLFLGEANCRACHFGANFSNGEFHDTGRPFFTGVGQVDPGRYTGIKRVQSDAYNLLGPFADNVSPTDKIKTANVKLSQENWGQWRTPSLRNLKNTSPYMHDGSLARLRDVVDAYADIDPARLHASGESLLRPLNLDDQQRNDLVAFLLSLSAD